MKIIQKLFYYRFELFFISQLSVLFGSLVFITDHYHSTIMPFLLLINILIGLLLLSKNQMVFRFCLVLLILSVINFVVNISPYKSSAFSIIRLVLNILFYVPLTLVIISQVWKSKVVGLNTIYGLMSGYLALGLLFAFLFVIIDFFYPSSFNGIPFLHNTIDDNVESFLYFSYVTLMTLGYGDIYPVTAIAQKATILCGLVGQFYLVIITGIMIGKFIKTQQ